MKIGKCLEEFNLLKKGDSEKIKNEVKPQKEGFLGILLHRLDLFILIYMVIFI